METSEKKVGNFLGHTSILFEVLYIVLMLEDVFLQHLTEQQKS